MSNYPTQKSVKDVEQLVSPEFLSLSLFTGIGIIALNPFTAICENAMSLVPTL
jgi:hypothetical protein